MCDARAGEPQREICDGVDNDCNRMTRDGSDDDRVGQPCDGPDDDQCEEGTTRCDRGRLQCSDDTGDSRERCDGADNDCDGRTDEAFPDVGNACQVGQGTCARSGRLVCNEDGDGVDCDVGPERLKMRFATASITTAMAILTKTLPMLRVTSS